MLDSDRRRFHVITTGSLTARALATLVLLIGLVGYSDRTQASPDLVASPMHEEPGHEEPNPDGQWVAPDPSLDLARLNGRWTLDWERSDSFEPVMKALEVPWLLRKLAGVVAVYITIAVEPPACDRCNPTLRIEQTNPIRNSSRTVQLDGVARPAKDPLGNETVDRFSWTPEAGMEMMRERTLDSGRLARIHEQRKVKEDLRTMISTMTVWVDDVERAQVKRILRKVAP